MNVIQTYYSYSGENNPIHDKAGFLSADMNWKSMALSCLLLKKHYGKVTLYCNRKVRHLVTDVFGIPYDGIVEIPDFMEKYEGCSLWALPKIYTYSRQTEPFIHVDCDWFMFERLSPSIESSDIIGQNIEYDDQFLNRITLEKLLSNGCYMYPWVMEEYNNEPILRVINAGILGGNDISFIQSYVETIKDFIKRNHSVLKRTNDGIVNSLYEQMFFYLMAKRSNETMGLCTKGDKLSTKFDWIPYDTSVSPKTGYMHLLANLKRRFSSYVFVSDCLRHLHPELCCKIAKCCYDNDIRPQTNYPQWDIYNSETTAANVMSGGGAYLSSEHVLTSHNVEDVAKDMEKELYQSCKVVYKKQESNKNVLWETPSLYDSGLSFSISNRVACCRISYETACGIMSGDTNRIRRLSSSNKDIYLALIPDASMMKVHKCILAGVRGDIIKLLSIRKRISMEDVREYFREKDGTDIESGQYKEAMDKVMRFMVVSNILNIA